MIPTIVIGLIALFFAAIVMQIVLGLRLRRIDQRQRADVARALGGVYMEEKFVEGLSWVYQLKNHDALDDQELASDIKRMVWLTRLAITVGLCLMFFLLYLKHWR